MNNKYAILLQEILKEMKSKAEKISIFILNIDHISMEEKKN